MTSLPITLIDTYVSILRKINEDHAEDALKILQWLTNSARPSNLAEVAEATAITLDEIPRFDPEDRLRHPTDVLAICSSLVHVHESLDYGSTVASSISKPGSAVDARSIHSLPGNSVSDYEHHGPSTVSTEDSIPHHEIRLPHYSVREYLV